MINLSHTLQNLSVLIKYELQTESIEPDHAAPLLTHYSNTIFNNRCLTTHRSLL